MSSLVSFAEKMLLSNLMCVTNNQYMVVTVEEGDIKTEIPHSRSIGLWTLSLSMLFTSPYVVVKGERNAKNEACLKRLQCGLPCSVVDRLTSPLTE